MSDHFEIYLNKEIIDPPPHTYHTKRIWLSTKKCMSEVLKVSSLFFLSYCTCTICFAVITNKFCPSRFSQMCPHFPFLQNANLYSVSRFTVRICAAEVKIKPHILYRFAFWRIGKSRRREIVEGFQLRYKPVWFGCLQVWPPPGAVRQYAYGRPGTSFYQIC